MNWLNLSKPSSYREEKRRVVNDMWSELDKINVISAKDRVAQILGWSQQHISYFLSDKKKKFSEAECDLFIQACKQAHSEQKQSVVNKDKLIQKYDGK